MRFTKPIHGDEARAKLKAGMDQVADSVVMTLGARGRNAVYPKYGSPVVTNDGVSIAREIRPEDPYEYLGAEMIKQSAERTNEEAGDGTTTTVCLTRAIIEEGLSAIAEGHNPMVLKKELEDATVEAVAALKTISTPVTDLFQVAKTTTENDGMARMVTDIIVDVGTRGHIIVEEGHGIETEVEKMNGYWFNRGYVSPYMMTEENGDAVLHDCAVFITDKTLNLNNDLLFTLSKLAEQGQRNVLVIADSVEGELLRSLIANKQAGKLNIVAVRRPQSIEELEDMAVLLGATAVTKDKGIAKLEPEHAGKATKVVVSANRTLIVADRDNNVELSVRIAALEKEVDESDEQYGAIELKRERLARMVSGLVIVRVGARTDSERTYLKLKVDDAIGALRAALEEGIVPGGGTALNMVANRITLNTKGANMLFAALRKPYETILANAGMPVSIGREPVNVFTGEIITDMVAAGIVDPAKVARCAIENAVSCAKTFLTTETAIARVPQKEKKEEQDQL